MAAIQPFVNLQPFKGTEKENFDEFLRQLESCTQVAGIPDDQRHRYLHLHLKGGALTFFDQQEAAVRDDYDAAVNALRNRYQNDQRIQLQKILFNSRKMKISDESPQDFLTELRRFALEAYPDIQARPAAGGRPAVNAENRAQERTRRVREAFINGMPTKMKRYLMTQPEDMAIEELCTKVSSRLIVDRLYPEDDDTAFNEVSNFSTKQLLTGIHELSKAQDTLKEETGKLSTELQELNKTLQPTINQLAATQNNTQNNNNNNRNNNNNNNNKNRQNWNKNFGPRGNNQQQWRNNNNNQQNWKNNQQNWKNNNNQQNFRPRNPNWQPRGQNWQNNNNPYFAQSGQKYCHYCNKFGHLISQCWFRPPTNYVPTLPYNQFSQANYAYPNQMPVQQPQMPTPIQQQPPWSAQQNQQDVSQFYQKN